MPTVLFYLFGAGAVFSACNVVLRRQAVGAAIWLVSTFFFLAAEYLLLGFPFLAAIQIMVYVGAIMVLFLFVIMLLDVKGVQPLHGQAMRSAGAVMAVVIGMMGVIAALGHEAVEAATSADALAVDRMTEALFTDFLLPFEFTSILLVAAIVGALTLGRSPARSDRPAQEDLP